jgi:hypothetical protein
MAQPDPDKLVADIDRQQNEEDLANLDKYVVSPAKAAYKKVKEGIMGTDEQNARAQALEDRIAAKDKDSAQAKYQSLMRAGMEMLGRKKSKDEGMKKGGSVKSSASKRADGCAQRGKTKGRII